MFSSEDSDESPGPLGRLALETLQKYEELFRIEGNKIKK